MKPMNDGEFITRPASLADLEAIVALRNADALDTRGTPATADHWLRRGWLENGVNLGTDTRIVETTDGRVIGYVELSAEHPFVVHEMFGAVLPAFRGQGIGSQLVAWAEQRARQDTAKAPPDARLLLHCPLFDRDLAGQTLLQDRGFTAVREFVHLQMQLTSPPPAPELPAGIEIRPLQSTDWPKVGPALEEAFADHWGVLQYEMDGPNEGVEGTPRPPRDPDIFRPDYFNSPGFCFVAWAGDEVAGSCLCNEKTIERPEAGYLGSLSIRRPWRRQGIGLALTRYALAEFYRRGIYHILTDTDGDSFTSAYRLYQKAGMHIYRREIVFEKELRPGIDWLRRELTMTAEVS
jgi:ribosomal protein S18 acetylase RimI-like enzyme